MSNDLKENYKRVVELHNLIVMDVLKAPNEKCQKLLNRLNALANVIREYYEQSIYSRYEEICSKFIIRFFHIRLEYINAVIESGESKVGCM